jgi:anaerobic magnesium-protoporphyrin IX monomethyl ester cyclase
MQQVTANSSRCQTRQGVLLLNPPIGDTRGPYLAIPQLAGYLKSRKIPVYAKDLATAFYKNLLTSRSIARGAAYVHERFRELNGASELIYPQLMEYSFLVRLLAEYPKHRGDIRFLTTPFADFNDIRESGIADYLLLLTSMPTYPEILMTSKQVMDPSKFYPYSSKEIIKAIKDTSSFTPIYRQLISEVVNEYSPRIVGFSLYFGHQIIPTFQMAAMLREMDPDVHITMGGPAISLFFREISNPDIFGWVDSLVLDDGEVPLERMYERLDDPLANVEDIPGVITCEGGQIVKTAPEPPPLMIDMPPPDFTVLDLDAYFQPREKIVMPLRISRGCPWQQCAFCRTSHPLCRETQTPDSDFVFEQLRRVYLDQGGRRFFFSTESADPHVLKKVAKRLLQESMKIKWFTHTRVAKSLTAEMGSLYARSGCSYLAVGVEAMSDRLLSLMRKGTTTRLIRSVFSDIGRTLPLSVYMMVGFPTETWAEALDSYESLQKLKSNGFIRSIFYTLFTLQQDSAVMKTPEEFGISAIDIDPDADLSPDVIGFQGEGMSREEAFELYLEFFNRETYGGSTIGAIDSIHLSGKKTEVRFDLSEIRRLSAGQWGVLAMPFAKWAKEYAPREVKMFPRSSQPQRVGK